MSRNLALYLAVACFIHTAADVAKAPVASTGTVLLQGSASLSTRTCPTVEQGLLDTAPAQAVKDQQQGIGCPSSLEALLLAGFAGGLLLWNPWQKAKGERVAAPAEPLKAKQGNCGGGHFEATSDQGQHAVAEEQAPLRSVAEALIAASADGDAPLVQALLKAGARADEAAADGTTPLHAAAARRSGGGVEVCELLLENRADLSAVDENGLTPLMIAAKAGTENTCELLYDRGGDTGDVFDQEVPPLLCAIMIRKMMAPDAVQSLDTL